MKVDFLVLLFSLVKCNERRRWQKLESPLHGDVGGPVWLNRTPTMSARANNVGGLYRINTEKYKRTFFTAINSYSRYLDFRLLL